MQFLRKSLLVVLFVMLFLLSPNFVIKAQQIISSQRQALITQIAQEIAQLQAQVAQILAQQQVSPGVPVRLKIPKINVDAEVDPVGITSSGEIGVPIGPATTSWFDLGPRPGDIGSAVIDGHFGHWKIGVGSVFDNLNKLVVGDKIYIEDQGGIKFTFVVRESRVYDPVADASVVFYSDDGKAHLNLVTCEGTWVPAQKTFTNRLVVFSDKE
jgi:LPXTG-site transpeptidase (sortase) family protein